MKMFKPLSAVALLAIVVAGCSSSSTTSSTTTSSAPPRTTTTTSVASTTSSSQVPKSSVAFTVTPTTDLKGGQAVTASAPSNLPVGGVGGIIECSSASPQPTMTVEGGPTPISCTNPLKHLVHFTAQGALAPVQVVIVQGTVGPPATGNDSTGKPAASDAASFPCPPTPAQVAAGAHCYLELGWGVGAGLQAIQPITFAGQ